MGFSDVVTYIQSGNILFSSPEKDLNRLTLLIEKDLAERFSLSLQTVVVTRKQLKIIVDNAPEGFGSAPEEYRYDVIFVKNPLTTEELLKKVPRREGVDTVFAGDYTLYFSRLTSMASQSRLSKIMNLPEYKSVTIRNWNTTTRLLSMMEQLVAG
jgi:uncharacterized protein (DUF1697 family)